MQQTDENCTKISFASESTSPVHEDLQSEEAQLAAATSHKVFSTVAILFTCAGCFLFLYMVSQNQNMYFEEGASCRMCFFSNFYFYFGVNFAYLIVSLHNLRTAAPGKQTSLWLLGSTWGIGAVFFLQLLFSIALFTSEIYACSTALTNALADLFIFQLMQYTVQFFIGLLYNTRLARESNSPAAKTSDFAPNDAPQVELFNASFALNETKSEANYNYLRNRPTQEPTLRTDFSSTNNLSTFTNSNIDTTKFGTVSADSCLNVSKFQAFRRSPRRKLNHVKELEVQM